MPELVTRRWFSCYGRDAVPPAHGMRPWVAYDKVRLGVRNVRETARMSRLPVHDSMRVTMCR